MLALTAWVCREQAGSWQARVMPRNFMQARDWLACGSCRWRLDMPHVRMRWQRKKRPSRSLVRVREVEEGRSWASGLAGWLGLARNLGLGATGLGSKVWSTLGLACWNLVVMMGLGPKIRL